MNDKAGRRMALLMEDEEIPEVVPPRPMTPEEKKSAVNSYLLTAEGQRAIQDAIDKEAGTFAGRIRHQGVRERARLVHECLESAVAVAAEDARVPTRSRTVGDNNGH